MCVVVSNYNARWAWIAIGVFVIVHNLLCPHGHTMSEKFDEWIEVHPLLARAGVMLVALHVANLLRAELDPIHQLFVLLGARKKRLDV